MRDAGCGMRYDLGKLPLPEVVLLYRTAHPANRTALFLVLPIPRLSLGDPLHRLLHACGFRLLTFCFADPLVVLALVARWESIEVGPCLPVLRERGGELGRHRQLGARRLLLLDL